MNADLSDLRDDLAQALRDRAEIESELRRRFPRGFDGNSMPGEYESLEADWCAADREVRFCREAIAEAVADTEADAFRQWVQGGAA